MVLGIISMLFWQLFGWLFWLGMNFLAFVLMGWDKMQAEEQSYYRINEKILLLPALFCGPFGSLLGMWFFRHKSEQWFQIKLLLVAVSYYYILCITKLIIPYEV